MPSVTKSFAPLYNVKYVLLVIVNVACDRNVIFSGGGMEKFMIVFCW